VSANRAELHRLLAGWHDPPDECCGKWTVDGKYFIFQSNHQIWALRQKNSFIQSEPKPIPLTSSPLSLSSPLPSRDGQKLFVIGQTYRGELMRYDAKSGQFARFLEGISAEYVAFSKDGQWVAYVSYPEGTLWRNKLDGSENLQLTYPPMYPVLPRWSPDGKKIVFFEFALRSDKPARIYEVSSESGTPRQLIPDDPSQQLDPNWSPDGSKIVYGGESGDAASAIRVFDLLRVLFRFCRQLHREPRAARRHDFSWPRPGAHAVPFHFSQPRNPFRRRAANGADDVLFLADGPVRDAPPNRTLDVPYLAVRFDHRRGGFRLPQGVCVLDLRIDPA
jgi:hypothetical protein